MGLNLDYIYGQTPIDEDERQDLLIETISSKTELDEFEQLNIEEAMQWLYGRNIKAKDIFTEHFIRNLHKRMFGNVWAWAGAYRKSNKNIGVDKTEIPVAVKMLCDDAVFWVDNDTYPLEEIAIRFKHRIVSIHCFPNGNGRHSRLIADIIIEKVFSKNIFTWGVADLYRDGASRKAYLKAVKAADNGEYTPLIEFALS